MKECIEDGIRPTMTTLSEQGGYMNPEGYVEYKGKKIKYLCYTNQDFDRCIVLGNELAMADIQYDT